MQILVVKLLGVILAMVPRI
ncbi:hypothetical protein LINGRAHAP2_LOCUS31453 [Linum grandiflorum]